MKSIIAALALLLVFAVVDSVKAREGAIAWQDSARVAGEDRAIWQARFAEASTVVRTNTVQVTKYATRYDTIRAEFDSITDTVIRDTVATVPAYWVKGLVLAADSTIAACRDLVNSCERLKLAADSTIAAERRTTLAYKTLYDKARPTWRQRFGLFVGYSLVASPPPQPVTRGFSVGIGLRLWP